MMVMKPNFDFSNRNHGKLGIIVPSSNTNLEADCALLVPEGVTTHFTRVGGYEVDEIPDAGAMRTLGNANLDTQIEFLMAAKVDVIGYGCASATLSCGWDFDRQLCKDIEAKSGVPAVTTSGAMVEALRGLGISTIGFASPYVEELNHDAVSFFESAGINVVNCANVGTALSSVEQGNLTPYDAFDLGYAADHPKAQAIVIGCTDFRAVEAIKALENALGKPVITSNQAMIDRCLLKIGL
jgi:maleate isomerase/arylmalonate decarboxylase